MDKIVETTNICYHLLDMQKVAGEDIKHREQRQETKADANSLKAQLLSEQSLRVHFKGQAINDTNRALKDAPIWVL